MIDFIRFYRVFRSIGFGRIQSARFARQLARYGVIS